MQKVAQSAWLLTKKSKVSSTNDNLGLKCVFTNKLLYNKNNSDSEMSIESTAINFQSSQTSINSKNSVNNFIDFNTKNKTHPKQTNSNKIIKLNKINY